ncbi:MAG: guanitoxin biosynthesis heme-dependent pre-guanitoxin N-hydroxylase GntA [Bdellovibrionales bacterium]
MLEDVQASKHLYAPAEFLETPTLLSVNTQCAPFGSAYEVTRISQDIQNFVGQKNYPCVAAIQSTFRKDFRVGVYRDFGFGSSWSALRNDLQYFLREQQRSGSAYLTFWAVYLDTHEATEKDFENALWNELSSLTSEEDREADWSDKTRVDPKNKSFHFCLDGTSFFVVGLHPNSSRKACRFPHHALVFNVFSQFESLKASGSFDPLVQKIRERDLVFDGSVNPVAAQHAEVWESIQFSGKNNPSDWQCPFQFRKKKDKPPSRFWSHKNGTPQAKPVA